MSEDEVTGAQVAGAHDSAHAEAISLHLESRAIDDPTLPMLDRLVWESALTLDEFIAQATALQPLWQSARRLAPLTESQQRHAQALQSPLSLLVLLEDWCGDAVHTIPQIHRLCEANPVVSMRVVRRDDHHELMHAHMSSGVRSIPVLIAYDYEGRERGWWGPRPSPLQQWVTREGMAMEKKERYTRIRTWFARDRGETTLREVLHLLQHASGLPFHESLQDSLQDSPTASPE
jgi:hypothetical protein